jgi:hypothetical protein
MALPQLTPSEKRKALEKAQNMRSQRAKLREKLKKGEITFRQVIEGPQNEVVSRMRVSYLLQSLPQVGKITSERIMNEVGIHANRRVQGLGKRQLEALLERLG